MSDCTHDTQITLTAKTTGKSRTFCGDCLYESEAKESKPFVMPEGGLEPYDQDAVRLLTSGKLTQWETEFLPSLAKMRNGPTDKQLAIWTKIVRKYFPQGLPKAELARDLPEDPADMPF